MEKESKNTESLVNKENVETLNNPVPEIDGTEEHTGETIQDEVADEIQQSDIIHPMAAQLSPETRLAMHDTADPTTPSLENWKLSEATRRIVHGRADLNHLARGYRKQRISSPVTPGLPETTITTRTKLEEQSFIESSSPVTPEMPEEIRSMAYQPRCPPPKTNSATPELVGNSTPGVMAISHQTNATPPTPEMISSPLRTTHIQPRAVHTNEEVQLHANTLGTIRDYDSDEEIDLTNILEDLKPATPLRTSSARKSKVFHDDEDTELPYPLSPPKAKLLVPSKCAIAEGRSGWIPQISEEEYSQAPAFLRMQVVSLFKKSYVIHLHL